MLRSRRAVQTMPCIAVRDPFPLDILQQTAKKRLVAHQL